VGINPGTYNVFNEDGTLFKWGEETTRVEVTTSNRVRFYVGDNEDPIAERHLPTRIRTLTAFDEYIVDVFSAAMILYATRMIIKLHKFQEAYEQIIAQKKEEHAAMLVGLLPTWRWIERYKELSTYQETCEDLMKDLMEKLQKLSPAMLSSTFTIIFTES
jgi:hypothetical protein